MKRYTYLRYTIIALYFAFLTLLVSQSSADDLPVGVINQFNHGASVYAVAFSPDGKLLASGGDNNTVKIWNVDSGDVYGNFTGHNKEVMSVKFSPDGKLLASACLDGFVRVWDVSTKRRGLTFPHSGWVKSVAFSPDAQILASGGGDREGSIKLWDVNSSNNNHIMTFPGHTGIVESIEFSPDGQLLVSTSRDKTAKLWDVNVHKMRKTLSKHNKVVLSVKFSPDGESFATSSSDNTIRFWNVATEENYKSFEVVRNRNVSAKAIAFSPDKKHLASACNDNYVRLWKLEDFNHSYVLRGHRETVTSVAFSPDGRTLATGSQDRTVLLWDLSHYNIVPSDPIPVPNPIPNPQDIPEPIHIATDTTPPAIVIRTPSQRVVPADIEQLPVRGIVTDNNGISEVKVNDNETQVLTDGRFTATVPLYGGENDIRVTATDIHGNLGTKRFTVNRPIPVDTTPPHIVILSPIGSNTSSDTERISIEGKVTDDSSVTEVNVNDQLVRVYADGRFTTNVQLKSGANEIHITATDTQGNMGTSKFNINWTPPPNPGPEIRILEPITNTMRGLKPIIIVFDEFVRVYGEVKDDDGVSEVRVNGAIVPVRGNKFEKLVPLNYKDNTIQVTATDRLGNQSEKKIIVYRPLNRLRDHALLFAVNDYVYWDDLHNPISDAKMLQRDLENIYNFKTRLVENPTKADIFRVFREYAEMDYTEDSQLFIFFAGHGHFDDTFKEGHLVSRDSKLPKDDREMLSYVSHSRVREIIDRMNCKHIFLVLDTCYSGTFSRELAMRGGEDPSTMQLTEDDITRIFQYTTRRYLTSGGKEQVPDDSPFVKALLEAMRNKGGADKILTVKEIIQYMEHLDNPKPCESGFGSDEPGSDFLFFAK